MDLLSGRVSHGPLSEDFSPFVTSMTAPVASGWSGLPGGTCCKAPRFHRARPDRTPVRTLEQPTEPITLEAGDDGIAGGGCRALLAVKLSGSF
jgi:hypothetical protein